MPRDEPHTLAGKLVRYGNGLLGVAGIIADFKTQLLAKNAAAGIQITDCHFGTTAHLFTKRGILPGHGSCSRYGNFRPGRDSGC